MATAASLIMALVVLLSAIQQIRANRRRGIRIEWSKTLVTGAGAILVASLAIGAMFVSLKLGREGLAFIAFFAVFGIGLTVLIVFVNRRWPRQRG